MNQQEWRQRIMEVGPMAALKEASEVEDEADAEAFAAALRELADEERSR